MDKKTKEIWRKCLILWEAISNMPSRDLTKKEIDTGIAIFKNNMLKKLGLIKVSIKQGCPFCQAYMIKTNFISLKYMCEACPINDCYGTLYESYEYSFQANNEHNQEIAEQFYMFLIERAKEAGYKPDFKLKNWT